MKSRACLVLLSAALLVGACELASPPQPSILAVEPAELVTGGESVELRLHIDALLPGTMDYGRRSVSGEDLASVVQVWLGERQVEVQRFEPGGILVVSVPADVEEGVHDLRLVLSDGREARRPQGLVVMPAAQSDVPIDGPEEPHLLADGGAPPFDAGLIGEQFGVSGFRIEPVADQVVDVPFSLALSAEGSQAASFQGMVTLRTSKGTIKPGTVGPFMDGVLKVSVTLDHPGNVVITAEDAHGNMGRTNAFQVRPH
jgi:hypothetical protein